VATPAREHPVFHVGVVQMRCTPDADANLRVADAHVRTAAARGAQIVCLPELFRSQYFCQREDPALFDLAEPIPGPTTQALATTAREVGVAVVVPLFERRTAGVYHNTAVIVDADGSIRGTYRKMHIPDDPLYYEKFYFTPGDLGFQTFPTRFANIGTLVCWDQWYPEAARLTALRGTEILFYPTAIGWHPAEKKEYGESQHSAWQTIQRSHAIANGVFVAAANRVGIEKPLAGSASKPAGYEGIEFWGGSFVCDPFGRILGQAKEGQEQVLLVECNLGLVEETRRHWPFLRDRRIDAYQGIDRRFMDKPV
jgi:N-carbamoylputrescine amidase